MAAGCSAMLFSHHVWNQKWHLSTSFHLLVCQKICVCAREFLSCIADSELSTSRFPSQLKKDKERLQAMMAHLKSSEPRAAAQPVSFCHLTLRYPLHGSTDTIAIFFFSSQFAFPPQANLVPNMSFSQATLPKGPHMSLSQSATAPSTPLMPLSESPSVLTPNAGFNGTPVRRRYSRSVSQGERQACTQQVDT